MRSPRWNDRRVDSMSRSRWLMAVAALALVAAGGVFSFATASSALPAISSLSAGPAAFPLYGSSLAKLRRGGGDVIPPCGGYSADHPGPDIAERRRNAALIAAPDEEVIPPHSVPRLDLDTEDNSLTNPAGVDRRNKAI